MRVPHHAFLAALAAVLFFSCLIPVPPRMVTLFKDSSLPVETRVGDLVGRMTLQEKIGQMTVAGSSHLARPSDIARLGIGSLLVEAAATTTAGTTAAAVDTWQKISLGARLPVPLLLAAGAVGSTRFPSAAGLAASLDSRLDRAVGRAAADELAAAGIRWSLDSDLGMDDAQSSVLAAVEVTREDTADADLASLKAALVHGMQAIRVPMSADRQLVTEVVKERMGFDGLVVCVKEPVTQDPPAFAEEVRTAVNAGIDMFVVPADYALFIETVAGEVKAGRIPAARIDDAVRRILRVKLRLGLFEHPFAAQQPGVPAGSAEHRELALRAVRESVVLLKNDGQILPLPRTTRRILVVGTLADDLAGQSGAAGTGSSGAAGGLIGTTIREGIAKAVRPGSVVVYDPQGLRAAEGFDVAIAVIGGTTADAVALLPG
ncbi:MAG: glycoside hydrolase family 3 N-terminal domain-containing protein, partial [Spirochaetia bacterium]